MTLTQRNAKQLCREWQKVMRLQDWDVKVFIRRASFFSSENVQGECRWVLPSKEATIFLLDPIDYPTDTSWEQDHEQTLVHELAHLHFAPFWDNDDSVTMEQAIDAMAKALVSLKRGK